MTVTHENNWAGNLTYRATAIHRPTSLGELRTLVASTDRIRALGTRHSFHRVADTTGALVSVDGLPRQIDVDSAASTVRVSAGLRYAEIASHVDGFALANMASLPHISVAGACATATHGSGVGNGSLATAVSALEMVTATGETVTLSRGDPDFDGAVVALGALGIVTAVTLDLVPAFEVRQYVYEGLAFDEDVLAVLAGAYSVSLFTDWTGPTINQVWVKQRTTDPELAVPAKPADGPRHPVPGMPAENCTQQLGVPGPWHERMPHFRPEFTPSAGEELQAEFMVARVDAMAALRAVYEIRERICPVLQISEIRTIAADSLWLSPFYQRDAVSIHFTLAADPDAVRPVLSVIERQLAPFAARPHWAKLFTLAPEVVRSRYPRLADFRDLTRRLDPEGKFRNDFVTELLAEPAGGARS
ncbi:D-arabinono-1,4-lactone oxidase [Actinocrispum wychmicini]|uniref:Xylitol oxidase n=1 Tax=Actinocrispum wychmicini TaxID=1213861 RepID=A0A4R2JM13_9PSEU|nr:D-arabinono-1,4-lactone oxidase [Actinocrispum wychmicini]TCO55235.1 xylitol oxidase [Actinocrispum wychmicini]